MRVKSRPLLAGTFTPPTDSGTWATTRCVPNVGNSSQLDCRWPRQDSQKFAKAMVTRPMTRSSHCFPLNTKMHKQRVVFPPLPPRRGRTRRVTVRFNPSFASSNFAVSAQTQVRSASPWPWGKGRRRAARATRARPGQRATRVEPTLRKLGDMLSKSMLGGRRKGRTPGLQRPSADDSGELNSTIWPRPRPNQRMRAAGPDLGLH